MKGLSLFPILILLFPLLGTIINGLFLPFLFKGFDKVGAVLSGSVATLLVGLSFLLSLIAFMALGSGQDILSNSYHWLSMGSFHLNFELKIDRLSSILLLVITGVGSLIHLYSIGYMGHDKGVGRYFAYLNLFTFFMLLLVLASNLPIMFFGWEGVGLCSYLLIGFWYEDKEKVFAGEKAFIMNRVGDLCLLLGMFLIFRELGTLNFTEINQTILTRNLNPQTVTLICLLLLAGATGKSAQLPLHTWLPDAMMGPTPVSALIHAATMVTAGVYMVVRLHPVYELSPFAMQVVAWIGAGTALFAATIAIAQNDIKKVLAYSTISQLGFMFLACGVGAFGAAIFHLVTHAFFKALLFLGAGSVIHATSGEQDMTKMGGLKKYIPQTYALMVIGALAISGLPLFSGFFSKDEILTSTFLFPQGGTLLFAVALLTAFLTAIYTARLIAMTFLGNERISVEVKSHIHESPKVMLYPLYVLAAGATLAGFLGLPHLISPEHFMRTWLGPLISGVEIIPSHTQEIVLMTLSTLFGASGLALGIILFKEQGERLPPTLLKVLQNKYYIDEIYDFVFASTFRKLSSFTTLITEKYVFDGFSELTANSMKFFGETFRKVQTGDIQISLLSFVIGLALILVALMKYVII